MSRDKDCRPCDLFQTAKVDLAQTARYSTSTAQTNSSSYKLAFADMDFMTRPELRPTRLQLELLKPEILLDEYGIRSTVVLFGGARIPEPGKAAKADTPEIRKKLERGAEFYAKARKFAQLVSEASMASGGSEFVIVSGGGPGIMEAANRGASDAGAVSVGHNIVLPHEQAPNLYITPQLCFQFHYFAIRKMHFMNRAKAIACFPGGFGTLDELFTALTLIQTGKARPIPVLLFGEQFWRRIVNFEALVEEGTISPADMELLTFVESPEEGWSIIAEHYRE
jgi:uncharacterized protein (TIGR00730 family)